MALPNHNLKIRFGPSGLHIFNRRTGLNVLVDEIRLPPASWARAPRQVSIALTNACDLECSYCFAPKNPATLSFERVVSWMHELDTNGSFGVGFGGGEPTLYRRLAELCQYLSQNTKLAVTLTTHGHHFDEVLASTLAGNVHFIRVSMDGVGKTYETLRRRPFALFLQRLEFIRSVAPFGINYVVNSRTISDLDRAIGLAVELGAAEFLLLPERPVRGVGGIDKDTSLTLRRWVAEYRGSVPLTISESASDGLPICNPLADEDRLLSYAHIDASGFLKQTSFDSNGLAIGRGGVMQALNELRRRTKESRI